MRGILNQVAVRGCALSLLLSSSALAQVGTNHVLHNWLFASNTLVDAVSGYSAALSNGATLTAEGVVLDGVDDYIELDAIPTNAHYSGAICLRLKPSGNTFGSFVGLIDSYLFLNSTTRAVFRFGKYSSTATAALPTNTSVLVSSAAFTTNQFHTIVFTWDAMWFYCYFDGKIWGKAGFERYSNYSVETMAYPDLVGKIKIGQYSPDGYYFAGTVAEVRFQDYLMTPAEAASWHSHATIKEKMEDMWYPQRGDVIVRKGPPGSWYEESVQEPAVIVKPGGGVNMLFTGRNNLGIHALGLASAPHPEGTFTVIGKVIGSGTSCPYGAAHSFVIQDQGIFSPHCFLYATDGNDGTYVQVFESNDYGASWAFNGIACPRSMLDGSPAEERGIYGNVTVWPLKQPDGYYYGIVEWSINLLTGVWRMGWMRSTSLTNGWEVVQRLDSVPAYPGCSATAPDLLRIENKWVLWYGHNGDEDITYARGLPDLNAFAWSHDGIHWKGKQISDRMYWKHLGYYTDQRQDFEIQEIGGWPYEFFSVMDNSQGDFKGLICRKKGKYPLVQLVNRAIRNNMPPVGTVMTVK